MRMGQRGRLPGGPTTGIPFRNLFSAPCQPGVQGHQSYPLFGSSGTTTPHTKPSSSATPAPQSHGIPPFYLLAARTSDWGVSKGREFRPWGWLTTGVTVSPPSPRLPRGQGHSWFIFVPLSPLQAQKSIQLKAGAHKNVCSVKEQETV